MKDYIEDVAERFDLPAEAAGILKATLIGGGRVLIENRRALLEYTEERVEVAGGGVRLRVLGDGLSLRAMDRDALLISGDITALELC